MAKTTDKAESALVRLEHAYPAIAGIGGDVQAALQENLAGVKLTQFDLERIKIPTGGMTAFELPDPAGGKPTYIDRIEGIIVFTKMGRSFWKAAYGTPGAGANNPPDCSSADNVIGIGDNGQGTGSHECARCPQAAFGTARDEKGNMGRGQACKQLRFIFLLREGQYLPTVLVLPPTSLKPMNQWLLRISQQGRVYHSFITRFELEKVQNAGGIPYAKVKATEVRALTPEEAVMAANYAATQKATFSQYHEGAETSDDVVDSEEIPDLDGDGNPVS